MNVHKDAAMHAGRQVAEHVDRLILSVETLLKQGGGYIAAAACSRADARCTIRSGLCAGAKRTKEVAV